MKMSTNKILLKYFHTRSFTYYLRPLWGASVVTQTVKNPLAILETWVQSLGWEDPLEEGMATHSSILAWRIPTDRGACGLQFMGSKRAGHDWATKQIHTYQVALVVKNPPAKAGDIREAGSVGSIPGSGRHPGGRSDNPLQYFCWRIPWAEEPGRLQSTGLFKESNNWSDLACTCAWLLCCCNSQAE